jgi:beta-glucosidase
MVACSTGAGEGDGVTDPGRIHSEAWPSVSSALPPNEEIDTRVEAILERMSLDEKIGQVIQAEIGSVTADDVRRYHLGSVLNGGGSHPGGEKYARIADWVALADAFWEASTDTGDGGQGIPVIWGSDAVHGHGNVIGATIFPHNVGLGAARDPELVRRIGEATAVEVRVTGLDWTFGPTLAVARDDRWGRTYESYSEDPEIVRQYAGEMVRGLQGAPDSDELLDAHHVIATAKHFLADGGTAGGKDQGDAQVSEEELRDVHAAGYATALEAGVQTVMASFSSWQGQKMHGNRALLTEVLKERMGFDGFVVGDWNAHGQLEGCSNESCAEAFLAGIDMYMVPQDWKALYGNTKRQVESGEIPGERLDEAVRRILRVKVRAGILDAEKPSERPLSGREELLGAPEHREVARQAVRESLVLLKNAGGLLPLRPDVHVLVVGGGADDVGQQCGGWTVSWQGTGNTNDDFPGATSIWKGIRATVEAAGGRAVLSPDGSFSSKPDVAIVVYGEEPYAEFQGDRETLEYQPEEKTDLALLRALGEAGVPVVSVFLSGRPLWVNPELNASDAFVAAWLPGTEGGGVADVLFRAADGSVRHELRGKLSFSWPRHPTQIVNRGDEDYDPLFPYGYGLTSADDGELPELPETFEGAAASSKRVYLRAGPVPPWQLYVGDDADPRVPASSGRVSSAGGTLVVEETDRAVQGDARAARWSGDGPASLFLRADEPIDLSREANGGLALSFDVLLEEAPSAPVTLAMGCGQDCSGALDFSSALAALSAEKWSTVRIGLTCFAEVGADMTRIDTPFLLRTDGSLALRLSDIRLASAEEGEAPCP